jgi:hypothetical protein
MVEAFRSALTAFAREQGLPNGPLPGQPAPGEGTKGGARNPRTVRGQLWQIAAATLVSAVTFAAVVVYMRLTADYLQIRSDLGKLRRELGLVRNELVRKDDFNARTLAANAWVAEAAAGGEAMTEGGLQRAQEQGQALAELRLLLRDLRREAQRLRERISAPEKQPGGPDRPSTPQGGKKSGP